MNLLLNLKRLHLSKSNKLASLVRRLLAAGSVDEFSRRTRARQPSLTAADLSKFDARNLGNTRPKLRIGNSDRFKATCLFRFRHRLRQ
jgi:hypothetical protein